MIVLRDQFCRLPRKLQFVITGGSGWVLGLVIMYLLIGRLGWPVKTGTAVMLTVTFAYTFTLNRYCTWHDREVDHLCLAKFVATRSATALATWLAISWLVTWRFTVPGPVRINYSMDYLQANTLCVALATVINWAGCDHWIFKPWLLPPRAAAATRRIAWAAATLITGSLPDRLTSTGRDQPSPDSKPEPAYPITKLLPQWPKAKIRQVRRLPSGARLALNGVVLVVLLGGLSYCLARDSRTTLIAVVSLYTLPMLVIGFRTLSLTAHYWRTPWDADASKDHLDSYADPFWTFDIIVPARHEEGVLYRNLTRIMQLDYPRNMFRVLVVVALDDPDTLAEARRAEEEFDNLHVVIAEGERKSKPISLNAAWWQLQSDLTFPLDAESWPAPRLLKHMNTLILRHPEVGVWQGGVQLMNIWAPRRTKRDGSAYGRFNPMGWRWGSAWRGHNCAEYRVWFKSRMQYQADKGFITLGGNTVFVWTHLIDQIRGWRDMVTEDCDLGVRLSLMEIPIRTFYLGDLVTREETPVSLRAHSVQRRRWILGFFQVRGLGEWRQLLSLRRRILAYELLSLPFWQAVSGLMIPVSLATVVLYKAPVFIVLWTYVPAALTILYAAVLRQAFRDFCQEFQLPVTRLYMVRFLLFLPIYQLALAVAALRALKRYVLGEYEWGITEHRGEHLVNETPEPVPAA
jgi:cellulose synthase/poly-beta-1,6-N-acetylglucosamine synthase-like glycosyltransferase/putative flippase GtrA